METYTRFKNRTIDTSKEVRVYKNLHNGMLSVKQDGLVVAHVDSITLKNPSFKVSKAGRNRVILEKKKNVHAFICGFVESVNVESKTKKQAISYNPYKHSFFYFKADESPATLSSEQMIFCSAATGLYIT